MTAAGLLTRSVGRAFHALTRFEALARRATGVVFLVVGMDYALKFDLGVL